MGRGGGAANLSYVLCIVGVKGGTERERGIGRKIVRESERKRERGE